MGRSTEQERAEKRAEALGKISPATGDDSRVANAQRLGVDVGRQRASLRAQAKASKARANAEDVVAEVLSSGSRKELRPLDYHMIYLALLRQNGMDVMTDKPTVAELSSWKKLAWFLSESENDVVTYLKRVISNWNLLCKENFIARSSKVPSVVVLCKIEYMREFWNILVCNNVIVKNTDRSFMELFDE